jgi:DNA polymerase-3 subunit chi
MTRVEFFFNVEDKMQKVAELSERAVGKGRRLHVFTPDESVSERLNRLLWTQPALSFLPHCAADDKLAEVTPVIIDSKGEVLPHDDILINLQTDYPPFFSRFRRLIEIVGHDEADKVEARNRFRFYRDRGYEIRTFDANGASL